MPVKVLDNSLTHLRLVLFFLLTRHVLFCDSKYKEPPVVFPESSLLLMYLIWFAGYVFLATPNMVNWADRHCVPV